jgi:hypothetical protein
MADSYAGNIFAGDFVELLNAMEQFSVRDTTTGESPVDATPTLLVLPSAFRYT